MAHEKLKPNLSTGELEEVNANFVQLYNDHLFLVREMAKENATALSIFLWLIERMDENNALVVSFSALAEANEISIRTAKYAVAYLKQKKAVAIFKSGNTNIYAVNKEIAWKSSANQKEFALFGAKVYVSKSEQTSDKEGTPGFRTRLVGHVEKKSRKERYSRNAQID